LKNTRIIVLFSQSLFSQVCKVGAPAQKVLGLHFPAQKLEFTQLPFMVTNSLRDMYGVVSFSHSLSFILSSFPLFFSLPFAPMLLNSYVDSYATMVALISFSLREHSKKRNKKKEGNFSSASLSPNTHCTPTVRAVVNHLLSPHPPNISL
jgi:hypothetical protein